MFTARRTLQQPVNPTGLCACGCGALTPLATDDHADRGYYKGHHLRFLPGHSAQKGEKSHKWRGGRMVLSSGYVVRYAPNHPRNIKGYVLEHRLVVEHRIGRLLEPDERVHHLNHVRDDNRDENLVLFPSASAHMREEHRDALTRWHATQPDTHTLHSLAGKAGAEARWRGGK